MSEATRAVTAVIAAEFLVTISKGLGAGHSAPASLQVKDEAEAIYLANDSEFGLAAGVFTESVDTAMKFARELETGNIHINWGPQWRADLMPYGGLKNSGFGKEGPRYAVEEMTELKMVVFHLKS